MVEYFGADRPLNGITPADADNWAISMKQKYAEATIARTVKRARQFYKAARRAKLVTEDPFEDVKPGSMVNEEKLHYISVADTEKVIAACPDAEWRGIVALARYGGLRCPSDVLALTWGDVRWDEGKFRVKSPKTEKSANKGIRWVPIFPELKPHLEAMFDAAEPGTVHVINRTRNDGVNLRQQLERIIYRGTDLEQWPRLFQNMRASCETDLASKYGVYLATKWCGNSAGVANAHYLQVTDADFARANGSGQAAHKAAQQGAEWGVPERTNENEISDKRQGIPLISLPVHQSTNVHMPRQGLEPWTR